MPGGNGTGPMGMGAMTGRGMGPCATGAPVNYGCGYGAGARRGFRSFYNPSVLETKASLQNRAEYLKRSIEDLQIQLDDIQKQLDSSENE